MAYISPTGVISRGLSTTNNSNIIPSGSTSPNNTMQVPGSTALAGTPFTDWHKALLWFLGGVLLIALAGPAPNIATMLLLIIIVGVLLGNWNDYAQFLGLANVVTGGSTTTN